MKVVSTPNQQSLRKSTPKSEASSAQVAPESRPSEPVDTITERIVKATVDKTLAGTDRLAGTIAGAGAGAVGYLSKLPSLVGAGVKSTYNLWKAETIGPNVKVLTGLTAPAWLVIGVVGAGVGGLLGVAGGAMDGWNSHNEEHPRDLTVGQAAGSGWNGVRKEVEEVTAEMLTDSKATRDKKLKPGEDPWDIPLPPFGRTAKTMAATVSGLIIGGVGGLVTAGLTTLKSIAEGAKELAQNPGLDTAAGLVGTAIGAPVTGALHGVSRVFTTPVEAARTAWKQDSLGAALKDGAKEAFQTSPGRFADAVGAGLGGAVVAVPSAAVAGVATTLGGLAGGLKEAATGKDLGLASRGLTVLGAATSSPVAGVSHAVSTALTTPVQSAAKAWQADSLAKGTAQGARSGYNSTKIVGQILGAAVGSATVAVPSAVTTTAVGAVAEVGRGLKDTFGNEQLNLRGKALDLVGGTAGDLTTAVGEGLGSFGGTILKGVSNTATPNTTLSDNLSEAARFATRSVRAAARPGVMLETVLVSAGE